MKRSLMTELPFAKPKDRKRKKNHSGRNRTRARHKMVLDLDADTRKRVFERDNFACVFAGSFGIKCGSGLQWAHVLSRRHPCARWEEDNGMTACAGHHLYWHHEPAVAVDWFVRNFPDRWRRLRNLLQANPKVNVAELWRERCARV